LLNVKINAAGLDDKVFARDLVKRGEDIAEKAAQEEAAIMQIVESKL
jgi:glutamate formiminotransferase/formiminotetrahydrofolate cyclodeaminase